MMTIEEIKQYMKEHKITYAELATRTGLSISTVTKIFGGYAKYPRLDTMQAIEKALGLDKLEERTFAQELLDDILSQLNIQDYNNLTEEEQQQVALVFNATVTALKNKKKQ